MKIRWTLADVTLRCFGEELGGELLRRGAVHPVLGADRKNPGFVGHNRRFTDVGTTRFEVLGLTAGEMSGLTVWDFDDEALQPPVEPNVLTRRGSHVYTPYAGEAHLQPGVEKLDIISNGNVVFWDSRVEKRFVHAHLADTELMHSFWADAAGRRIKLVEPEKRTGTRSTPTRSRKRVTSTCAFQHAEPYPQRVEQAGFQLDLTRIERGAVLQMQSARGGARNTTLHRKTIDLIQCGLDPWVLEGPALSTGLKPAEVHKTIEAALRTFDPSRVDEVMQRAVTWAGIARSATHPRVHSLIDGVARMAVEQNTLSPMVVQSELSSIVNRSTTSRRLDRLASLGLLIKKSMGTRPDGRARSNCYTLTTPTSPGGTASSMKEGEQVEVGKR